MSSESSNSSSSSRQRVVIVGSGCAGLSALYTLSRYAGDSVDVTLVEASSRLGGHAYTITAPTGPNGEAPESIDVGFMVMNRETYPNLLRIFGEIGARTENSDMSLAISDPTSRSWSFQSSWEWMMANLPRPRLWRFISAHAVFAAKAKRFIANPNKYGHVTVGEFCQDLDQDFAENWLLPFVAAVWSAGVGQSREFSALPLLRFMSNHRFLGLGTIPWRTLEGRSHVYVRMLIEHCRQRLRERSSSSSSSSLSSSSDEGKVDVDAASEPASAATAAGEHLHIITGVRAQQIHGGEKVLELADGRRLPYDALILAGSAPTQAALHPPSEPWLREFAVSRSRVCVHFQPDGMPQDKNDWSAWNVRSAAPVSEKEAAEQKVSLAEAKAAAELANGSSSVTYWLSRIQNLKNRSVFISLNPKTTPGGTFFDEMMEHPIMDLKSFTAQSREAQHQGINGVYHAGAWLRHGFHEDGFLTGVLAARRALGCSDIPVEYPTAAVGDFAPKAVHGLTVHTRYQPVPRSFRYPLMVYRWDTRCPPEGYHRLDHFGDANIPLDTCVRRALCERVGVWPLGRIDAVANLRCSVVAGVKELVQTWLSGDNIKTIKQVDEEAVHPGLSSAALIPAFNPITPYFAHDENGRLIAVLLEVHNTPWGERCLYAMRVNGSAGRNGEYELEPSVHQKSMHVSPFNPPVAADGKEQGAVETEVNWSYKFTLRGEHFLEVELSKNGERVITATMELNTSAGSSSSSASSALTVAEPGGNSSPSSSSSSSSQSETDAALASWQPSPVTHNSCTGSWRSLFWVYFQAVQLALHKRFTFYPYSSSNGEGEQPIDSPEVWSWILLLLPALRLMVFSLSAGLLTRVLGVLWMVVSICMAWWTMSGGANLIPLVFGSAAALLAGPWTFFACSWMGVLSTLSLWMVLGFSAAVHHAPGLRSIAPSDANVASRARTGIQLCLVSLIWTSLSTLPCGGCANLPFWLSLLTMWFTVCGLSSDFESAALGQLTKLWDLSRPTRSDLALQACRKMVALVTVGEVEVKTAAEMADFIALGKKNDDASASASSSNGQVKHRIVVHRPIEFFLGLLHGDLGFGESYVAGHWDVDLSTSNSSRHDTALFAVLRCFAAHYDSAETTLSMLLTYVSPAYWSRRLSFLRRFGSLDRQSAAASIHEHYDDGNNLFRAMLGDSMVYTAACYDNGAEKFEDVFEDSEIEEAKLVEAQARKIDRILSLTRTPAGGAVLDIGSGWGHLVHRARSVHGYDARGLCNCANMIALARNRYGEFYNQMDYRDIPATHTNDAITCVEMIEAVPARHYPDFVAACDRALRQGGRVCMQVIHAFAFNNPVARTREPVPLGTFVTTHIFPGQQLPNLDFLHEAFVNSGKFRRTFTETCGHDYARTLRVWAANLERAAQRCQAAENAALLSSSSSSIDLTSMDAPFKFDEKVIRKYRYYLAWCRAGFDAELLHVSRVVFEKI